MSLTAEDQKRLRLQGISKAARHPMFQGRRKDVSAGNFERHVCYACGRWADCEMEKCTHAVCVRMLPCCDPKQSAVAWSGASVVKVSGR